jgi:hypothetical protein
MSNEKNGSMKKHSLETDIFLCRNTVLTAEEKIFMKYFPCLFIQIQHIYNNIFTYFSIFIGEKYTKHKTFHF